MGFGGFTLFILISPILMSGSFVVLWLFHRRKPKRHAALAALLAGVAFETLLGLYLFKVYYLDEGLVAASMNGDATEVQHLLRWGADPEAKWEDGKTAIECATRSDHLEIVAILKKAGAKR